METRNGQLGNVVQIGIESREVGGEENVGSNLGENSISGDELRFEVGRTIENEDGLVDLNPLSTRSLQISKEGLVDGNELGEKANGLEAGLSILSSLSKNEERDRAEDNGASGDTSSLGFLKLFNGLVEVEFEFCLVGELGDDKVVVGVEPRNG
jgi:hypothetical protein